MLLIDRFSIGELEANCYFVRDDVTQTALIVDMGVPSEEVYREIDAFGGENLQYILLTHGHFDHIGNTAALKRRYPRAAIVIGRKDDPFTSSAALNLSVHFDISCEPFRADRLVDDGEKLPFGNFTIQVIGTPGHTAGGVCYQIGDNLFTGDTIISPTTGRTDFPTGNSREMIASVRKIAALPGNPHLFCGHGEESTLAYERKYNMIMRNCTNEDLY